MIRFLLLQLLRLSLLLHLRHCCCRSLAAAAAAVGGAGTRCCCLVGDSAKGRKGRTSPSSAGPRRQKQRGARERPAARSEIAGRLA
jgi:hypothetical protein